MVPSTTMCTRCGKSLGSAAKFCVHCGQAANPLVACMGCNAELAEDAKFCPICGMAAEKAASASRSKMWVREPGDVAARFEMSHIKSYVTSGVDIEEGTEGVLFQHGEIIGTLPPGNHVVEDMLARLKALIVDSPCSVIIVDRAELDLSFRLSELRTADDQLVDAEFQLVAWIDDAIRFCINHVRSQTRATVEDLRERIAQQVAVAVRQIVAEFSLSELGDNGKVATQIEAALQHELPRSFERLGLQFRQLAFISFEGETFEEIRNQRADLARDAAMLEIAKSQNLLNRSDRELYNADFRDNLEKEAERDRAKFEVKHELESGVQELQRQSKHESTLREAERNLELTSLRQEHSQQLRQQQHRGQVEQVQQRQELLGKQLSLANDLNQAKAEAKEKLQRESIQASHRFQEAKLQQSAREHSQRLGQKGDEFDQRLEQRSREQDLQWQQEQREAELAMSMLQQTQQARQARSKFDADLETNRKRNEHELRIADAAAAHQLELERMEKLSTLTGEALIAAAPADRAQLLSRLREVEALKGLSEEQILARAAENSPEIARAFAEKFKASAHAGTQDVMQRMYERMLEIQQQSNLQASATHHESMHALQALMETALQTRGGQPSTAAHGPTTAAPQSRVRTETRYSSTTVGGDAAACNACGNAITLGCRFCSHCGAQVT